MSKYEVMFIINPSVEDEKKENLVNLVQEVINSDGQVSKVDVWGLRKLAYPIEKKSEGYYVVIDFEGNPTLPRELDRRMRNNENIMRQIIVSKEETVNEADTAAEKPEARAEEPVEKADTAVEKIAEAEEASEQPEEAVEEAGEAAEE